MEMLEFKKNKIGTNNTEEINKNKEETKLLSNLESRRIKFIKDKKNQRHQEDILKKLDNFKSKIQSLEG